MKAAIVLAALTLATTLAPVASAWPSAVGPVVDACASTPLTAACEEATRWWQDAVALCPYLIRRADELTGIGRPPVCEDALNALEEANKPAPAHAGVHGDCVEAWQETNGARGLQRESTPNGPPADHRVLQACPPILPS